MYRAIEKYFLVLLSIVLLSFVFLPKLSLFAQNPAFEIYGNTGSCNNVHAYPLVEVPAGSLDIVKVSDDKKVATITAHICDVSGVVRATATIEDPNTGFPGEINYVDFSMSEVSSDIWEVIIDLTDNTKIVWDDITTYNVNIKVVDTLFNRNYVDNNFTDYAPVDSFSISGIINDVEDPIVASFAIPAISNSLTVLITEFTATDDVEVAGYILTETSDTPSADDLGWSPSAPASHIFGGEGSKTLYAWAKDAVGKISTSLNDSVLIDTIAPVTTDDYDDPKDTSWKNSNQTITLTSIDPDGSGIAWTKYCIYLVTPACDATAGNNYIAPVEISNEGIQYFNYASQDNAGNVSAQITPKMVKIDKTIPTGGFITYDDYYTTASALITYNIGTDSGGSGLNEWSGKIQRATAPISGGLCGSFSGFSDLATVHGSSYADTTVINGNCYKYQYLIKDNALNQTIYTAENTAMVDTARPSVVTFTIPVSSESLTIPITTFTASDNIGVTGYLITETSSAPLPSDSGWLPAVPTSYTLGSEGNITLYAWVKDAAGNVSLGVPRSVVVAHTVELWPTATQSNSLPPASYHVYNTVLLETRDQFIITASDLTGAGLSGGDTIIGIQLKDNAVTTRPSLANFRIQMQQTTMVSTTSWIGGWTTYFGPTNILRTDLIPGQYKEYLFDSGVGLQWDGTSNVMVNLSRKDTSTVSAGSMWWRTNVCASRTFVGRGNLNVYDAISGNFGGVTSPSCPVIKIVYARG